MNQPDVEVIVIGAGVVGLAIARQLAMQGREVIILDQGPIIGSETSSRNSEVIHAGIYYPANSLKAKLCVQGKQELYAFCESHNVPYKKLGKLIVATSEAQTDQLKAIEEKAIANGVTDLAWLTKEQAQELEPNLSCTAALLSPSTGIVDSHALMLALQGEAEAHGAALSLHTQVSGITQDPAGYRVTTSGEEAYSLTCKTVINAAGHGAVPMAESLNSSLSADQTAQHEAHLPKAYIAKGSYFRLSSKSPFSRLIYPVPEVGGLGVHLTLDLGGQAKFGPDVEWVETWDAEVAPERAEKFYDAVRAYWPDLPDDSLEPDYCGFRPKISGPNDPAADFAIVGPSDHGLDNLVHLFGIESPGLTACLAIAEHVAETLNK